ncbi:uncharacterized protein BDR25DRAFT_353523 [Lindgomyces ingoldianus]|uniref:Uncharacterized protein n=1 Tax=Lindgomyces ingoldianus TaxID=673940 RepID=A0ACB6R2F2_9PLEO|nr:uncharacterized protein BDR25DRAFT_353523 [Lindgomyces ingoldianus]KAF2472505.1 hypothetical protein BDR25DRAFT_353523 [Lindgomyces ingoldianus]
MNIPKGSPRLLQSSFNDLLDCSSHCRSFYVHSLLPFQSLISFIQDAFLITLSKGGSMTADAYYADPSAYYPGPSSSAGAYGSSAAPYGFKNATSTPCTKSKASPTPIHAYGNGKYTIKYSLHSSKTTATTQASASHPSSATDPYKTTTITTHYVDVCSTGYTTISTTLTVTYPLPTSHAASSSGKPLPTPGKPLTTPAASCPPGFTVTAKYCASGCGAYPTTVTVTIPVTVFTHKPTGPSPPTYHASPLYSIYNTTRSSTATGASHPTAHAPGPVDPLDPIDAYDKLDVSYILPATLKVTSTVTKIVTVSVHGVPATGNPVAFTSASCRTVTVSVLRAPSSGKPATFTTAPSGKGDSTVPHSTATGSVPAKLPSVSGKPSSVSGKPSSISGKPSSVTGKPSSVSGKPSSVSGKPSSVSGKPSSVSGKPSSISGKPSSVSINLVPTSVKPSAVAYFTGGATSLKVTEMFDYFWKGCGWIYQNYALATFIIHSKVRLFMSYYVKKFLLPSHGFVVTDFTLPPKELFQNGASELRFKGWYYADPFLGTLSSNEGFDKIVTRSKKDSTLSGSRSVGLRWLPAFDLEKGASQVSYMAQPCVVHVSSYCQTYASAPTDPNSTSRCNLFDSSIFSLLVLTTVKGPGTHQLKSLIRLYCSSYSKYFLPNFCSKNVPKKLTKAREGFHIFVAEHNVLYRNQNFVCTATSRSPFFALRIELAETGIEAASDRFPVFFSHTKSDMFDSPFIVQPYTSTSSLLAAAK